MIDDSIKYCIEIEKEYMKSILFASVANKSSDEILKRENSCIELKNRYNFK